MKSILDRLQTVAERLRSIEPSALAGPADDAEIQRAEQELHLSFPNSYKWFLREFGAADSPFDIFGLEPCVPNPDCSFWNIVSITNGERAIQPPLPLYLIPICPDGTGNHWCLNSKLMANGECPVVFWNHDSGEHQELKQTHSTFLDWLEDHIVSVESYY